MSAIVDEQITYTWHCRECVEGGGPSDDDDLIQAEADTHDGEHHGNPMTARTLTALIAFTLTIAALQTPPESLRFVAGVWLTTPAFWFVIASIVVVFVVDRAAGRSE